MSFLSAISHKDVLSCTAHSSLRTPHHTGCGCNIAIFFLTCPKDDLKMCTDQLQLNQT